MKHIIFYGTKGGLGKSTFCNYFEAVLRNSHRTVAVVNLDEQQHINIKDDKEADFCLYDTPGNHTDATLSLLDAAKGQDVLIIVPTPLGETDFKEVPFAVKTLEQKELLSNTLFVLNRARSLNSRALQTRKKQLKELNIPTAKTVIRNLDDITLSQYTPRAICEFSALIYEVLR